MSAVTVSHGADAARALGVLGRQTRSTRGLEDRPGSDDEPIITDFHGEPIKIAWSRTGKVLTDRVVLRSVTWTLETLRGTAPRDPTSEVDTTLEQSHQPNGVDTLASKLI